MARLFAPRRKLSPDLVNAVRASKVPVRVLARMIGYQDTLLYRALNGAEVAETKRMTLRLVTLSSIVHFQGPVFQ